MAVMTTPQSSEAEAFALGHKTEPVPSSDTMAVDYEVNGNSNSNRDDLSFESPPAPSESVMHKTLDFSPSVDNITSTTIVNVHPDAAAANNGAHETSLSLATPPSDSFIDSQPAEESFLVTETSTLPIPSSEGATEPVIPLADTTNALDSAIESAIEDTTANSSVLPVVEAEESDQRDVTSSLALPADSATTTAFEASIELDSASAPAAPAGLPSDSSAPAAEVTTSISELSQPEVSQPSTDLASQQATSPPAPTEADPTSSTEPTAQADVNMTDAPTEEPQQTKIAREREDDTDAEPAAKRAKTDDDLDSSTPKDVLAAITNGEGDAQKSDPSPLTQYQVKEITKIIKSQGRTKIGATFRVPVVQAWPALAELYTQKVPNPTDLNAIEQKLKDGAFASMGDLKTEINRLYENAVLFNGPEHTITKQAADFRNQLLSKIGSITAPVPKVAKKQPKKPAPVEPRAPTLRGPSKSAPAPALSIPDQTYALDPHTNTPTIRRDSTKIEGGRPKREIHPPKNKELPYQVRASKPKKFAAELKFCDDVLAELKKPKHQTITTSFMQPVDPVALAIPQYFTIVKTPMDLSTVASKLHNGEYTRAKDFESDVRLIVSNAKAFNPPGNYVRHMSEQFESLFNAEWAKKNQYISDHTAAAASPVSADSEEEASEDEGAPEPVPNGFYAAKMIEEQNKLIALTMSKTPDTAAIQLQQQIVALIGQQMKESSHPPKKAAKTKAPRTGKKPGPKKAAVAKQPKKKAAQEKKRYMGTLEKEIVANGLSELPEPYGTAAINWIKEDQKTALPDEEEGELELDIETISLDVLWRVYDQIIEHAPHVYDDIKSKARRPQIEESEPLPRSVTKPAPKKKNKPMSKTEQEEKIAQLRNTLGAYEGHDSGSAEPPLESVEQDQSSGDEESDSEEE